MNVIIDQIIKKDRRDLGCKPMADVLIMVDLQNDFLTGSLGISNPEEIIDANMKLLRKRIDSASMERPLYIILTQDTHDRDEYTLTLEGQMLPVGHCFVNEPGWQVDKEIQDLALAFDSCPCIHITTVAKPSFGSLGLQKFLNNLADDYFLNIEFTGLDTDICVVSNALIARATLPNTPITVYRGTTTGTTEENTEAAFSVMQSCQIVVKSMEE